MSEIIALSFCLASSVSECEDCIIESLPFGPREKNRIRSIKRRESRLESLAALFALQELLSRDNLGEYTLLRTENGKPYFEGYPCFFSLSHSCGLSVAVTSNEPIGADVEWFSQEKDFLKISKRFFHPTEHELILNSPNSITEFYSLWTKREALSKISGKGIASMFDSPIPDSVRFKQYMLELGEKRAILSVCVQGIEQKQIDIRNPYKELKIYELQN